jgi:DNA-binding transcriptional LysR family regulator
MLTLDAIVALDMIARKGSFASAAKSLGKVPSALSYQIRKLEDELDALIFDRRQRKVTLTMAGEMLLKQGRELLKSVDLIQAQVKESASGWEQHLRITCDGALPLWQLHALVKDFDRLACPTQITIQQEVLDGCWESLLDSRCDLLIGALEDAPNEVFSSGQISVRPFGKIDFAFCMAPDHSLAKSDASKALTPEDLRTHRAIAVADSARRLKARTTGLLSGQPVLTVATMNQKLEAQVAGLGIGYLPRYLALGHLKSGQLIERKVAEPKPSSSTSYAWRRARPGKALSWWLSKLDVAQVRRRLLLSPNGALS